MSDASMPATQAALAWRQMADVEPLQALHYDLAQVGGLQPVAAPPYDVIDAAQRAELLVARSPYNVVEIDLPQNGGGSLRPRGRRARAAGPPTGIVVRDADARPVGAGAGLHRARTADRARATASSRACASRTTAPGASARTSARTRVRRRTGCGSRAPRARTSRRSSASTTTPPTPPGARSRRHLDGAPWGEVTDEDGHACTSSGASTTRRRSTAVQRRAGRHRAADRRRPPPLRDRPRLPAGAGADAPTTC